MNIGFTGTQRGMTIKQLEKVFHILIENIGSFSHHGDCIGADAQFHFLAVAVGSRVVIHPPDNPSKRAYCYYATEIREDKPYLRRNQDIVNESDILIATPGETTEQLRSGTWATIRRGRKKKGMTVYIIYPDGTTDEEVVS